MGGAKIFLCSCGRWKKNTDYDVLFFENTRRGGKLDCFVDGEVPDIDESLFNLLAKTRKGQ
jgi:hypothetical protein